MSWTPEQLAIFGGGISVGLVLSPVLFAGFTLLRRLGRKLWDLFHEQEARLRAEYQRGYDAGRADGWDAGYKAPLSASNLRHGERP